MSDLIPEDVQSETKPFRKSASHNLGFYVNYGGENACSLVLDGATGELRYEGKVSDANTHAFLDHLTKSFPDWIDGIRRSK